MKPPKVAINGVVLTEVRTRQTTSHHPNVITSVGKPDITLREDGDQLVLGLYALTVAQLYFDGVLPQDRATPIEVKVGRRKPSAWVINSLHLGKDRWQREILELRLARA